MLSPASTALSARHVDKSFDNGVVALDDVSFELPSGTFASIVGPSGCGKSTLLRLIAGLSPLTGGELTLHGTAVDEPRREVGMMFQEPTLLPWRTALQNVLIPVAVHRRVSKADKIAARDWLRMAGLSGFEHAYPRQLSGGMQQRVALARLLMTGADVLLLDEPFGALDEFTRERLNIELAQVHSQVAGTTLFVTHNIQEAVFLADQVLVMTPRPGRLAKVLEVPFERPRSIDLMKTPEFNELVFEVREILGAAA
ncbi:ABC transporter ATP-binding protein [Mycolicibacterium sp.]|uniref:ABC transporter ATP-binding protein n=1 Tax=Mycolicibacterium sp. TaxID=2320850 RepID=UPI003D10F6F0